MEISARHMVFASSNSTSLFPLCLDSKAKASYVVQHSLSFPRTRRSPQSQCINRINSSRKHGNNKYNLVAFSAAAAGAPKTLATEDDDATEKWLLQPVGDGDSRHIGSKVSMPGAFEIASNTVTVGRLPEKADMVIPVATVSSVHARIQKKGRNLLVTDLDSTNGTYIDSRRLKPGVAATISPGNCVTFGDVHLAMFRVSKLESVEASSKSDESGADPASEASSKSGKSGAEPASEASIQSSAESEAKSEGKEPSENSETAS